jgi:hypothetical protein
MQFVFLISPAVAPWDVPEAAPSTKAAVHAATVSLGQLQEDLPWRSGMPSFDPRRTGGHHRTAPAAYRVAGGCGCLARLPRAAAPRAAERPHATSARAAGRAGAEGHRAQPSGGAGGGGARPLGPRPVAPALTAPRRRRMLRRGTKPPDLPDGMRHRASRSSRRHPEGCGDAVAASVRRGVAFPAQAVAPPPPAMASARSRRRRTTGRPGRTGRTS